MKSVSIDFTNTNSAKNETLRHERLNQIANDAIIIANEKANNLEPWNNSASSYLINNFLSEYEKDRKLILNFKTQQKTYNCDTIISENIIHQISEDFSKSKNKKNAYKYSSALSKQLIAIVFDYLNYITNDTDIEIKTVSSELISDLESTSLDVSTWNDVPSVYTSRFKNFERDLLIGAYPSKGEDVDNKGMRGVIYSSSQLFYAASNNHFFILSYSPANEQYFNQKIKDVNKAPSFSFMVFDREAEDYFVENYEIINNLHRNFMQFTYLSDTNQNIVNAMGEASLISQYWYTESVNRILKDHEKELKKAQDSTLLAEYIVRYILAAEIEDVELIEVYPFDRVFMFNNSVFSKNSNQNQFTVFEGLLESKIPDEKIEKKEFLGGETQFAYEWEREKTGLSFDSFDPSKKKIKTTFSDAESFQIDSKVWINDYNKDDETVINNLLTSMLSGEKEVNKRQMLEYKSKYSKEGITYLYSSGTNLSTQIESLYNLQEHHLHNIHEDKVNGLIKDGGKNLFKNKEYFDNVKVVLFSYTPDDEFSKKGFTLLMIANDDVPKALMEQKAEKDDLHTALKLLINQHFTIDLKYKESSIKAQNELIDILTQTEHSIKNSFETFEAEDNLDVLKEKIIAIVEQSRIQMLEHGSDATIKKFIQDNLNTCTLQNSFNFFQSLFSSSSTKKGVLQTELSRKFDTHSSKPWDFFAKNIYELKMESLKENRIYSITWSEKNEKDTQLTLIIDFNELQNFSFDWKESLFNDAIYVMLKNSCEHSMETFRENDKKREIFLDLYISNINDQESLNIEFTNQTNKICKDVFNHINRETTIRGNAKKENSTGIGVVTIRKRLDATYGLELSDIKFTMVNENTIKSLLYFPIKSDLNDSIFISSDECSQNSNIIYLEDTPEYYKQNKKSFFQSEISCYHDVRYSESFEYENYNLLITDLNIFGQDDASPSFSNGEDAILDFIEANESGSVIVLSSDVDDFKRAVDYTVVKLSEEAIVSIEPRHIYLSNQKILTPKLLEIIKIYSDSVEATPKTRKNTASFSLPVKKQEEIDYAISDISSLAEVNSLKSVDSRLFICKEDEVTSSIVKWQKMSVEVKKNRFDLLTNCEVVHKFKTKLVLPVEENILVDYVYKHESMRRNMLFISLKDVKNIEAIKNKIAEVSIYKIQKNGIFGKISHDILNKMPEFSKYTQEKIEKLKVTNNKLRVEFNALFESYVVTGKYEQNKDISKLYIEFMQDLQVLKNEAIKKRVHLGTDIANIELILAIMNYVKGA